MKLLIAFLLCVSASSCNQNDGPENSLKKYVNYRFGANQTKEGILERTTGKMNEYVATLENNELDDFLQTGRVQKKNFRVKLKKCTEEICFITYTVGYNHLTEGKKTFEVEVKKIAELRFIDNTWKIYDVNNVKTYMDSKEEISP